MNTKTAANQLYGLIENSDLPEWNDEYGKVHLRYMINQIVTGEVSGEKSHRWLGWIQACICMGKGASLENMKRINKEA